MGTPTEKKSLLRPTRNERGATMVEYALLVGCLSLLAVTGMANLGIESRTTFEKVSQKLANTGIQPTPIRR